MSKRLLDLPINHDLDLTAASYKNPGRLLIRSHHPLVDWKLYFGITPDQCWHYGTMWREKDHAVHVLPGAAWKGIPYQGGGAGPKGGPNVKLAIKSQGLATYEQITAADKYVVWAVHPDEEERTPCYWVDNDMYNVREDSGYGTPKKFRRSVPRFPVDRPPGKGWGKEEKPPVRIEEPKLIAPVFDEIVFADRFSAWQHALVLLDLGLVEMRRSKTQLDVGWGRGLNLLPRFENGRFGRLCWVCWDPYKGKWIGGHGEHLRIAEGMADESLGSTIAAWTEDGLDLGETLAAKSKLEIDSVAIEDANHWACFVVTHDQNPAMRRSLLVWNKPWGESPPPPPPTNDYEKGYATAVDDAIRALKTLQ